MINSILVVEDNEELQLLYKLVLELAGYQVATVNNEINILDFVEKIRPQLILMDTMMSGINGLQISRKIKENFDNRSLPVLLVSAINGIKDRQLADSKADSIIYKPFNPNDLTSQVKKLISH
ncbi:PleD family two-component system response regulator [Pleurocapsa sp. PCC 7319]|uniref:response regulator n=1 Tax=Pleurocapsa sp. PCC 7319 TaxID=118161 RepID=UPI000344B03C|nr:response regulator [Pleurocapsa sp. PCC 7319]